MVPSRLPVSPSALSISCRPSAMIDDGKSYECFTMIMIRYDSTLVHLSSLPLSPRIRVPPGFHREDTRESGVTSAPPMGDPPFDRAFICFFARAFAEIALDLAEAQKPVAYRARTILLRDEEGMF